VSKRKRNVIVDETIEDAVPDDEKGEIEQLSVVGDKLEKKEFAKWWKEADNLSRDTIGVRALEANETGRLGGNNVRGWAVGEQIRDGRTTGKLCVTVYTEIKAPPDQVEEDKILPEVYEGVPINVVESGIFRARQPTTLQPLIHLMNPRLKYRPSPGGVSIGHPLVTAGTFGCLCMSTRPREEALILSNNHVLAASNQGKRGDDIVQPGILDGGRRPGDVIAKLFDFIPLKFNGEANHVDAALAKPVNPQDVTPQILRIGTVRGMVCNASINTPVQKSGRTTGHTRGNITGINASVRVSYREAGTALFKGQYIITPGSFSDGGDSGSLVLDDRNRARALLFAGSTSHTIATPICRVLGDLSKPPVRISNLRIRTT
jgi:hypothetical protein